MNIKIIKNSSFIKHDSVARFNIGDISDIYEDMVLDRVYEGNILKDELGKEYKAEVEKYNFCQEFFFDYHRSACNKVFDNTVNWYGSFINLSTLQSLINNILNINDIKEGDGDESKICDVLIVEFIPKDKKPFEANVDFCDKKRFRLNNSSPLAGKLVSTTNLDPKFNCPDCVGLFGMKVGGIREIEYIDTRIPNKELPEEKGTLFKSKYKLQFSIYSISYLYQISKSSVSLSLICKSPVIPGITLRRLM